MDNSTQVQGITLHCACGNKECVAEVTITDINHARLSGNMYSRVVAKGHTPTHTYKRVVVETEGYEIWQ